MSMDDALEKAARAICADDGTDADEKLEWGPYVGGSAFRVHKPKERWRLVIDELHLRQHYIALIAMRVIA